MKSHDTRGLRKKKKGSGLDENMAKRTSHACMGGVQGSYFLHGCEYGGTHDEMGPQSHGLVASGLSPKQEFLYCTFINASSLMEIVGPDLLCFQRAPFAKERGGVTSGGCFMWDDAEHLLMTQTPQALQGTDIQ